MSNLGTALVLGPLILLQMLLFGPFPPQTAENVSVFIIAGVGASLEMSIAMAVGRLFAG